MLKSKIIFIGSILLSSFLLACQLTLPPDLSEALPVPPTTGSEETTPNWWNETVFYEVFVRSFQDSNGDGKGDLPGLMSRLDYLNDGDPNTTTDLGITGIWLMPVSESPSYHGYDVLDYRQIERDYGSNEDFQQFIDEAHQRGMKVIVDLVTNHTSVNHPWFRASDKEEPDFDDWYVWQTERPDYRGPWNQVVWHRSRGRYYYGIFWQGMPDLNYENSAVTAEMYDVARFWLEDMGVDGFRLDAVKHIIEVGKQQENTEKTHHWLEEFHDNAEQVNPQALLVGEIWSPSSQVAQYINESVDIAFEFDLAGAMLSAVRAQSKQSLERIQKQVLTAYPPGQYAAFLSNHDQNRVMSTLQNDIGAAKVAATLLLTNPGVPFIYYGEEIGMVGTKPDERIRTPMQWDGSEGTAGFTTGNPWQRLTSTYSTANVQLQTDVSESLLSHYRNLIHLRQIHPALQHGTLIPVTTDKRGIYSFIRQHQQETLLIIINLAESPVTNYRLSLETGPLAAETISAEELLGQETITVPISNNQGGFDDYLPRPLKGRESIIIKLQNSHP